MPLPKKIIIVKLISGLGNQLFQYAFARQLALKNNIPLKLDTIFFKEQELRNFSLHHYCISATLASTKEIYRFKKKSNSNKLLEWFFKKVEKYVPVRLKFYYDEKSWWTFDNSFYKLRPSFYIEGYWQNFNYYKNLPKILKSELCLQTEIGPTAKETLNKINNDPFSVAIHVRRGDYITDQSANQYMGVMPLAYYQKAIDRIKNEITSPSFYIFTDDIIWVKQNFKLEQEITFIEGNKDFEDLELMQNCKHQIIANSSFSWWGAFLNTNPNKIVICPKNWLANNEENKLVEIQMPEWIKI